MRYRGKGEVSTEEVKRRQVGERRCWVILTGERTRVEKEGLSRRKKMVKAVRGKSIGMEEKGDGRAAVVLDKKSGLR